MGRTRKPKALKIMQGTVQPCRDGGETWEPPKLDDVPDPPDWLSSTWAVGEWNRVAPMLYNAGILTDADLMVLGSYCQLHGNLVTQNLAGIVPSASHYNALLAHASHFGMTPSSRAKAVPASGKKDENPFKKHGKRSA